MTIKIGILTTHPIQYQVPWFRRLAATPGIDLCVYFCMIPDEREQGHGFGIAFQWDVPLLDGYRYEVLENVARNPTLSRFDGCDTPGIARIVRDGGFDAFFVNGWVVKSCIQLLVACRRHGVPCIVRGESNNLRPRSAWKRLIHRILLSQYRACLYIGEGNRRFYLENGVRQGKLFFAPYCVENERFSQGAEALRRDRKEIRAAWGIPEEAVTFVFCAKFVAKKRPMDILKALMEIKRTGAAPLVIHVLMVGAGELLDACRSLAVELGLPLTFAGFLNQSEMSRAYAVSDCMILPSDHGETWGLVVNEGMACGLPAIVSDQVGCHLDLVTPGVTGEVFPMGDAVALADCIRKVAEDPRRTVAMGREARERVRRYSYDEVVQGTLAALAYVGRKG
jgi:glycosyltransferase involved in cell wall biosynthesis